jgi:SAM-dependent methyltransferase
MTLVLKNWLRCKLKNLVNRNEQTVHLDNNIDIVSEQRLRRQIASQYLSGQGIEVGALHSPLDIPDDVKVSYVDRMSVDELRKQYPELAGHDLVKVDIIDDGENLLAIADSSLDFVIANHMIEHCQNPIGTIKQHLRVLKPNGILYMAVPDMRYTFDRDRPVTSLDHLIRDYTESPSWSVNSHFEEWSRLVEKTPEDQVSSSSTYLMDINYSIHFHVWTQIEFLELLLYCKQHYFNFEIELLQKNGIEFITILRKIVFQDVKS